MGLLTMVFTLAWHLSLAAVYGTSGRLDVFWVAYAIPKALIDSLHLGILSFVFILVWRLSADEAERSRLASALINQTLLFTLAVAAVVLAAANGLVLLIGPGLPSPDKALAAQMMRWLVLMLLPSALAGIVGGALYAQGRFAAFSTARALAPLVQFVALLILAPRLGDRAPLWAALAGPAAMGIVCVFLLGHLRIRYTPAVRLTGAEGRAVLRVFLVLCGFALLERANQTSDRFFATLAGPGTLSLLEFAWRLEIPVSQLLSLAVGLPTFVLMARAGRDGHLEEMRSIVRANLRLITLFVTPLIGFLVVLREPLVQVLFLRGAFTPESAATLTGLVPALGVMFTVRSFGVVMVLGFLAIARTRRLLGILIAEIALNTLLNVLVYDRFGLWGIVAATAVAMVASNLFLWRSFSGALAMTSWASLPRDLARPIGATATSLAILGASYTLASGLLQRLDVPEGAVLIAFALCFGLVHLLAGREFGEFEVSMHRGWPTLLVTRAPMRGERRA